MSQAYQDHCNANYGPEDIPRYETCGRCMGAGYSNHPDSGEFCEVCGGSGGVEQEQKTMPRNPKDLAKLPVKSWNMQSAIAQIKSCNFGCEAGPLENNDAWRWIVMTYGVAEPRTAAGSLD